MDTTNIFHYSSEGNRFQCSILLSPDDKFCNSQGATRVSEAFFRSLFPSATTVYKFVVVAGDKEGRLCWWGSKGFDCSFGSCRLLRALHSSVQAIHFCVSGKKEALVTICEEGYCWVFSRFVDPILGVRCTQLHLQTARPSSIEQPAVVSCSCVVGQYVLYISNGALFSFKLFRLADDQQGTSSSTDLVCVETPTFHRLPCGSSCVSVKVFFLFPNLITFIVFFFFFFFFFFNSFFNLFIFIISFILYMLMIGNEVHTC